MALRETVNQLKNLLEQLCRDLEKGMRGNRAASQRARTASVKFSKIAKLYRKESISDEKSRGPKRGKVKKKIVKKRK